MKGSLLLICSILALPMITTAKGDAPSLVNPIGSGLKVVRVGDLEASFTGELWVSGTFRAEWPAEDLKELRPDASLSAEIELDKSEMGKLPRYGDDEPPMVWIENETEAVQMIFSKDIATSLLSRKVQAVVVHGRFLVKDISVGECGSPWARAKLMTGKASGPAKVSTGLVIGDC